MSYTPEVTDKVSRFTQFFYDAWRTWGLMYAEGYRDLRAYAGDNWTQQEKQKLLKQNRMILELNKIRRVINLYSGYERENRTSTVLAPMETDDEDTADIYNDLMYYVYEKGNADYAISEAFEHSLKTGLGIIGIYLDYENDKVNGDIKFYWKPFNAVMLDPYFTKRDLSDCDQASTRDLLSKEEVKALLPWVPEEEIDNIPTGIRDNKYQYLGIYRQYNANYIARNLVTYDQYWTRVVKKVKWLVDLETGQSQEWDGTEEEEAELQEMLANDPSVEFMTTYKRTVELNIIVGGVLLYSGPDPTGLDDFPFVPVIAFFEPLIDSFELKIQGLVRSIRDAQRVYNRRHSQIIDIMEGVINTGWISKNGAVLDPSMLYQAGCSRNIIMNEGTDLERDIKQIQAPSIPPGYLQYQDIIDKDILEIPGGSEELLGLSSTGDSQVSGRLAELRASQGLKGNRGIFDNLEQSKKYLGRLVAQCIQKNYTPGKVWRITNKEPTPQFYRQGFGIYDVVVKQDIKTPTQQEAYYYQLLQLLELGAPIPWSEVLANAPIQGRTRLTQVMQQIEQQQQEQQQLEQEQLAVQREIDLSTANENHALAQERRARVLADIGLARERISESTQNYSKALLDNAKTVREIQDIEDKRLMDVLKMATDLKIAGMAQQEQTIQSDIRKAEQLKQ